MGTRLFVYGTLMFPDIFSRVAGPPERSGRAATLLGWRRHALRDAAYPALLPAAGARVVGMLYDQLVAAQLQRLDDFEGPEYQRDEVTIAGRPAWVYRWIAEPQRLLSQDWDAVAFTAKDRQDFLGRFLGWSRLGATGSDQRRSN